MEKKETSYRKAKLTDTFWATIVKPFILDRDMFRCKKCGTLDELEVHSKSGTHLNTDDLITLCKDCHYKVHGRKRRK